ncbi:MAG: hypothetical protein ACM3ML_12600 [Micromonosporaceae bacterium]
MQRAASVLAAATVATLGLVPGAGAGPLSASAASRDLAAALPTARPIKHLVVVFQENILPTTTRYKSTSNPHHLPPGPHAVPGTFGHGGLRFCGIWRYV